MNAWRSRFRPAGLLAGLAVLLTAETAAAQTDYEHGRRRWQAGQYQAAHDYLVVFRKQPGGRRPEVDYMLGTSACRIARLRSWGHQVLDWMLYAYPLTRSSRQLVTTERDLCRGTTPTLAAARFDPLMLDPVVSAGMSARGKMFYYLDAGVPVASYPARRLRPMAAGTFEARLHPPDARARAVAPVRRLVPRFRVEGHSRFVIATSAGQSGAMLRRIAGQLDGFLGFLTRRYGVATPRHLLTVYLVPDVAALRTLARDLHGLDVSPATIGYTFRDDLSVVAVMPGQAIGTLYHELFHLVVRDNFGDIPQWLDEGIAGLYEVSSARGDEVRGEPNWRGRVLEALWHERPTVEQVVASEWFPFDVPEGDRGGLESMSALRVAAHLATARYFALYLQERDKLGEVYASFRDQGLADFDGDARTQAVRLVERTLGQPIAAVDADFERWFKTVEGASRAAAPAGRLDTRPMNQAAPAQSSPNAPPGDLNVESQAPQAVGAGPVGPGTSAGVPGP